MVTAAAVIANKGIIQAAGESRPQGQYIEYLFTRNCYMRVGAVRLTTNFSQVTQYLLGQG